MFPTSPLRLRLSQQLSPSFWRIWRTCLLKMLWMMPPSTFMVMGILLMVKKKLLNVPIILRMWKGTMLQPSSSRYYFLFYVKFFGEQLILISTVDFLYLNHYVFNNIWSLVLHYPSTCCWMIRSLLCEYNHPLGEHNCPLYGPYIIHLRWLCYVNSTKYWIRLLYRL